MATPTTHITIIANISPLHPVRVGIPDHCATSDDLLLKHFVAMDEQKQLVERLEDAFGFKHDAMLADLENYLRKEQAAVDRFVNAPSL